MVQNNVISPDNIRLQFTAAMSQMYKKEVPLYAKLKALVESVNDTYLKKNPNFLSQKESINLSIERHGAIRLGTAAELSTMRRLFAVMDMLPVDYYDLSVAGIPVHSTAFRAIDSASLQISPFRVFTSLLRLDLIENNELRQQAVTILASRRIFSESLLSLIKLAEEQDGLNQDQAKQFVLEALETFRWHQSANVNKKTYDALSQSHRLITDIVSFNKPHINHLTPTTLDIDAAQTQLNQKGFKAKAVVEGPPVRNCPILLRQTSFIALEESVTFSGGESGTHTARFGEIEQRGVALTPKGRALYDRLLQQARNANNASNANNANEKYKENLNTAFLAFPDNHKEMRKQALAYYRYSVASQPQLLSDQAQTIDNLIEQGSLVVEPIVYEDFLPVSAAGIFQSNLSNQPEQTAKLGSISNPNQEKFEEELGASVIDSFSLYERIQKVSLDNSLKELEANTSANNSR